MQDGRASVTAEDRRSIDGEQLLSVLELDSEAIERSKALTRFTDADADRVEALESDFAAVADDLVDEFYDHITAHGETSAVLDRSTKTVEQLKQTQRSYLLDLVNGEYDADYFASRARVGKIHDVLGVDPRMYLSTYTIYYEGLVEAVGENVKREFGGDEAPSSGGLSGLVGGEVKCDEAVADAVDAVVERTVSVLKLLSLDQQVGMETYLHSYNRQAREAADRRRRLASEVEREVEGPIAELLDTSGVVEDRAERVREMATEQADDMVTVSEEVSQMSATVEEIAATAEAVEERSTDAAELAAEGERAADEAIEVMESVTDSAAEASDDVRRLQEQIDQIDEIIEAINDVAEQTNLLALNASIEAARAGEAGEGFAVVADEVKSLAEQSQEQASEVEATVKRIQTEADETVESLGETTDRLHAGVDRGEDAMNSLGEIVDAVERAAEGVSEVAEATDEQAVSAEEVTATVETARERATEMAEEGDDVAETSRAQTDQVESIRDTTERLVTSGDGPVERSAPASPTAVGEER
jgi:heme-based aerotactic transducer